jgi:hypothetical protein
MVAIEEGARIISACREHGISSKTLFMRVARDAEAANRFAQAKQMRLQRWHEEWLGEMHEHAKRSPWATAWLLERNFPEFYALREFTRPVTNGSQPIGDQVSADQLRQYAALMDEFRRENESKARGQNDSSSRPGKRCRLTAWESNCLSVSPASHDVSHDITNCSFKRIDCNSLSA